jgi:effector-binding domain-containing protein
MSPAIAIHQVEPQAFVSVREHCDQREIAAFIQGAFAQLFRCLGVLGIAPSGSPFVIYHSFGPSGVDAEVALPVRERIAETECVLNGTLPAMVVARAVHIGPYDGIARCYSALSSWVEDHSCQTSGIVLERYLVGPNDNVSASEFRTEIEMPLAQEAVAAPV